MLTSPVKGHFLSMKAPSMADWGVLKPIPYSLTHCTRQTALTETDLFVESNTVGRLFGQEFFGVKENSFLLLESSLSLNNAWVNSRVVCIPECRSSVGIESNQDFFCN